MSLSKQFSKSSVYYDTVYKKKNYRAEAKFIHSTIQSLYPNAQTVLDVGCGTGSHIYELSKYGYSMTGIDVSLEMLRLAKEKCKNCIPKPVFLQKNTIGMNLHRKYDCVVSLFHVASYMTTNSDVKKYFMALSKHTASGGICMFDCWFGPGVIHDPPVNRKKRVSNKGIVVVDSKKVTTDFIKNTVTVLHKGIVRKTKGIFVSSYEETHILRYFFYPELEALFTSVGFSLHLWGTLKNKKLVPCNKNSWDVFFVLIKN